MLTRLGAVTAIVVQPSACLRTHSVFDIPACYWHETTFGDSLYGIDTEIENTGDHQTPLPTHTSRAIELSSLGPWQGDVVYDLPLGLLKDDAVGPGCLTSKSDEPRHEARRFACSQCNDRFLSQKDVDRHISSVHDRAILFFCHVQGCRRVRKGFTRKDNRDAHYRRVHGSHSAKLTSRGNPSNQQVQPAARGEHSAETRLSGFAREELVSMLLKEQEIRKVELSYRREIEDELKTTRARYEKREDMLLQMISKYGRGSTVVEASEGP